MLWGLLVVSLRCAPSQQGGHARVNSEHPSSLSAGQRALAGFCFSYQLASTRKVMAEKPSFSDNVINSFLRQKRVGYFFPPLFFLSLPKDGLTV